MKTVDPSEFFEGAILTGNQIAAEVDAGRISISGFDLSCLNENSYNVTLNKTLLSYNLRATDDFIIDLKSPPSLVSTTISPKYGYVTQPGKLYLGSTNEIIASDFYVPIITGRSSFGRLGFEVHQTGNFGDLGYSGAWTLQIKSTFPTRIYPGIKVAQIYFMRPYGQVTELYHGKYQGSTEPTPSRIYSEIDP